jgi:hypothetical protein
MTSQGVVIPTQGLPRRTCLDGKKRPCLKFTIVSLYCVYHSADTASAEYLCPAACGTYFAGINTETKEETHEDEF